MKKLFMFLILACLLLSTSAIAEEAIPTRYAPILESWSATTAEELHLNILEYWKTSSTVYPAQFSGQYFPLSICFNGTTNELI